MSDTLCRILDNSFSLFKENGFNATSVSEIATSSGILKGSLYNHFKSKEDILIQVVDGVETQFIKTLQCEVAKDFEEILTHYADFFIQNDCCLMANLLNESLPEKAFNKIITFFANWKLQLVDHMHISIPLEERIIFAEDVIMGYEGSVIIKRLNRNNNAVERLLANYIRDYKLLLAKHNPQTKC